jgi:hypothetical protein
MRVRVDELQASGGMTTEQMMMMMMMQNQAAAGQQCDGFISPAGEVDL